MQEVYDFLKKCGTYYLATTEGEQPRVRPFGTVNMFEGKLYIQTGKSKNCSKQIQENGKVEICALSEGKWVRIACRLVRDERREAKAALLDNYPHLRKRYSEDDENTEVLYMDDAVATFSSFTEADRVVKF